MFSFQKFRPTLAPAALTAGAILLLSASTAGAGEKPTLPDAPGRTTTEKVCGSCHGVNIFANRRESRDGWSGIVEDMIQRGAKGTDDEFGEVVDYLAANLGKNSAPSKINVNKASAKDFAAVLGVSAELGAAIVKQRESQGDFKTIEDLKKVPGLDPEVVEAKKSKLEF